MAPEARVYYPPGQEGAFNTAIATVSGAKIIGKKESSPLPLAKVSPHKLAEFLQETTGLEISRISYHNIFSSIRPLPVERQKQLLASFFSQRVRDFPNPEGFAEFLADMNVIPWLTPTEEPDYARIQGVVDRHQVEFGREPLDLRLIRDWDTVWDNRLPYDIDIPNNNQKMYPKNNNQEEVKYLSYAMTTAVVQSGARKNIERSINESSLEIFNRNKTNMARRITMRIGNLFKEASRWTMDHAGTGTKSPYQPLIDDIFKSGGWPIGQLGKEYLVFFPSQSQPKPDRL